MSEPNPTPNEADATATDTGATPAATEAAATGEGEGTILGGDAEGTQGEAAGAQAGEGEGQAGAEAAVPESYTLTPPDGFEAIDTEVLADATPVFKELGLTNEQADKLTPIAANLVKKTMDRAEAAITDRAVAQRREWAEAFEADPEIGGANRVATIQAAARFFDHYGIKRGEGIRQILDDSGLGNHPDMIRVFAAVGRDLAEGSFDRGDVPKTPKAPEQKLYAPAFQPKG